jgi:hypothetical protein
MPGTESYSSPCDRRRKEERITNKVVVSAATVAALAIGTAAGLALSSTTNLRVVVSCEGNSCSVQLPGVVLDEMNRTMTKTMTEESESEKADEQAVLREMRKVFGETTVQHDVTVEDSDAVLARQVRKLFQ